MSDTFKPAGVAFAAVVAAIPGAHLTKEADAAIAAREAEADALVAAAQRFAPAEPFAPLAMQKQGDLFDL